MKNSLSKKSQLKKKSKERKSLKRKKITRLHVWNLLSQWVRLRDCLETTGTLLKGKCKTCGKQFLYGNLQGGHVIDGHTGRNYLDERGVFIQCVGCNVFKHGNKEIFIPWFIKTYGQELYDELLREKEAHKWTQDELLKLKEDLEEKIKYIKNL